MMKTSVPTRILAALVLALLPIPLIAVIGASVSPRTVLSFPPTGFSLRWYIAFLSDGAWIRTFAISAGLATLVAVVTSAVSLGAALALQGASGRLRTIAETAILSPLLFPHAALGIGFLGWLAILKLSGSIWGVMLAHLVLCVPFAYRPIAVALKEIDASLPEAALILGAEPRQAFTKVVLPMLRPGLSAALLFSFIISFDEVTVTMFLVGPDFTTLPVSIWSHIADTADPIVAAISTILIAITASLVILMDRLAGLKIFVDMEDDAKTAPKA